MCVVCILSFVLFLTKANENKKNTTTATKNIKYAKEIKARLFAFGVETISVIKKRNYNVTDFFS